MCCRIVSSREQIRSEIKSVILDATYLVLNYEVQIVVDYFEPDIEKSSVLLGFCCVRLKKNDWDPVILGLFWYTGCCGCSGGCGDGWGPGCDGGCCAGCGGTW